MSPANANVTGCPLPRRLVVVVVGAASWCVVVVVASGSVDGPGTGDDRRRSGRRSAHHSNTPAVATAPATSNTAKIETGSGGASRQAYRRTTGRVPVAGTVRTLTPMRVPELTPRAFRRLTLVNLVLLAIIIVSGAACGSTDSGLGCADWPNCNADNFVSVGTKHEAIEQLNRLFSGAILVPIVLVLVASYRLRPRRRDFVRLSWVMLVLYLGNAVLGGISVLVKLAWVSVMGHFLLAIALVGVALTMHKRAANRTAPRALRRLARACARSAASSTCSRSGCSSWARS